MDEEARQSYLYSIPYSLIRLYENISYCRRLVSLTSCNEQLCVAAVRSTEKFRVLGASGGLFWGILGLFSEEFSRKIKGGKPEFFV